MELLVLAVGIAERVIFHFLQERESRLRVETLEHEVQRLARETTDNDAELDVLRLGAAAEAEAYSLVDQLDGLTIEADGRLRRRRVLVRSEGTSPAAALEQLQRAVDRRRRELVPQDEPQQEGDVPRTPEVASDETVIPWVEVPVAQEDPASDPAATEVADVQLWPEVVVPAQTLPDRDQSPVDPRLVELARRVQERRQDS